MKYENYSTHLTCSHKRVSYITFLPLLQNHPTVAINAALTILVQMMRPVLWCSHTAVCMKYVASYSSLSPSLLIISVNN